MPESGHINIQKISVSELDGFVNSEAYKKLSNKPISYLRAASYINNPHALPDDIVLYMAFIEDMLVAYRTIWADTINFNGETHHFGWCSGNWVHPRHRRQGFSHHLLDTAYTDWNGKLMFTNYAEESFLLYMKSRYFKLLGTQTGLRLYIRPDLFILLKNRMRFPGLALPVLWIGSACLSILSLSNRLFYRNKNYSKTEYSIKFQPDKDFYEVWQKSVKGSFNRTAKDLEWILKYPWISSRKSDYQTDYYFSNYAKHFFYRFITLYNAGKASGFILLQIKNGHLKIPYYYAGSIAIEHLSEIIARQIMTLNIRTADIYDPLLSKTVARHKNIYLSKKPRTQNIFSTFGAEKTPISVCDGDGDYIFT